MDFIAQEFGRYVSRMSKECLFKTDDSDQFSTLSVEDIDGYGYDGRIFEKRNVNTTNFEEVLFLELVVWTNA